MFCPVLVTWCKQQAVFWGPPGRSFTVLQGGEGSAQDSPHTAQALLWVSDGARGWVRYRTHGIATAGCPRCVNPQSPSGAGPGRSMHDGSSGLRCFALINRILLSLSLWTHGLCPWSLGAQLLWVRGWPHQLAPCGFLHISAHQCVWGQCLVHNEMTFHWACKTDASRSEISWTPVSKPAGRAGVAQSLMCVTVAGSLAPCPGGKAPIPSYLIFFFLCTLSNIFCFVLFQIAFCPSIKKNLKADKKQDRMVPLPKDSLL